MDLLRRWLQNLLIAVGILLVVYFVLRFLFPGFLPLALTSAEQIGNVTSTFRLWPLALAALIVATFPWWDE